MEPALDERSGRRGISIIVDRSARRLSAHIGVAPDGTSLELSDPDGFSTSIGNGTQPSKGAK